MADGKTDKPIKVEIRDLYKIFGPEPQAALEQARAGVDKPTLLSEHGHVLGLSDISIRMREGDITVIMGLSGSGKSTLIRHLNRLIEPTAGEVLVDGENILDYTEAQLRALRRARMSMVFQSFALLPHRTVAENAALALDTQGVDRETCREEATRWLDRVGLEGYADHYPRQLSGGMQQRVGIARALTSNAPIMLMDEAFSALDPLIRTDMQDLLLELQTELKKTVVFITHDLDEALKLADHLVILNEGAIVQQDEPQSILLDPADDYVRDFVSDVNRARVLRVRSVMRTDARGDARNSDSVDCEESLEAVLARSGGDLGKSFTVTDDDRQVGVIHLKDVVRALVPTDRAEDHPAKAA
jgi:glycine betaine/proline transport system ATP-binding protein